MRGSEAQVVEAFVAWLEADGWTVEREVEFCDVVARRGGEVLYAEAKGRTAAVGLDVDTLYGQLLRRVPLDAGGARFGVVVPSEARTTALRVPASVRHILGITVYVVDSGGIVEVFPASPATHATSGLPPTEVDAFGIPTRFFGPHPETIWGAIGRTVALSALLEDRLVALLQNLNNKPQTAYSKSAASEVVEKLRKAAPSDQPSWDGFGAWLDAVGAALEWRNDVVHNLWPAQPGDRLFGHRIDRKTGQRRCVDTTTDELPRRLLELVDLTQQWDHWFALANHPLRQVTSD